MLLVIFFMFFFKLIFNWRIIALQCCVGFCCTTTRISHEYTQSPPSWTSLPPSPTPPLYLVTGQQVLLLICDWSSQLRPQNNFGQRFEINSLCVDFKKSVVCSQADYLLTSHSRLIMCLPTCWNRLNWKGSNPWSRDLLCMRKEDGQASGASLGTFLRSPLRLSPWRAGWTLAPKDKINFAEEMSKIEEIRTKPLLIIPSPQVAVSNTSCMQHTIVNTKAMRKQFLPSSNSQSNCVKLIIKYAQGIVEREGACSKMTSWGNDATG